MPSYEIWYWRLAMTTGPSVSVATRNSLIISFCRLNFGSCKYLSVVYKMQKMSNSSDFCPSFLSLFLKIPYHFLPFLSSSFVSPRLVSLVCCFTHRDCGSPGGPHDGLGTYCCQSCCPKPGQSGQPLPATATPLRAPCPAPSRPTRPSRTPWRPHPAGK